MLSLWCCEKQSIFFYTIYNSKVLLQCRCDVLTKIDLASFPTTINLCLALSQRQIGPLNQGYVDQVNLLSVCPLSGM